MFNLHLLDRYRFFHPKMGWEGDSTCGAFSIPSPIDGAPLMVIASQGAGWDHVSVSRVNRCPNWPEMEKIRRLFFLPHHGGVRTSTQAFLRAVGARWLVRSGNERTVDTYNGLTRITHGVDVWNTADAGAVTVVIDGDDVHAYGFRRR